MDKCWLNNKAVYAKDIYGKNKTVNHRYEKELRIASKSNLLKCDECGSIVIFKSGKVREPHFSHKSEEAGGNGSCSYESDEHLEGKRILREHILNSFSNAYCEMRYRFTNGRRTDLYFKFEDGVELVVEFQRDLGDMTKWEEKKKFYKEININNLWIVSGDIDELNKNEREYQYKFADRFMLNENNNKLIVLDTQKQKILIMSKIAIHDFEGDGFIWDQLFKREYSLSQIKILPNGEIECDFNELYEKEEEALQKKFKEAYEKEKEKIEDEHKKEADRTSEYIFSNSTSIIENEGYEQVGFFVEEKNIINDIHENSKYKSGSRRKNITSELYPRDYIPTDITYIEAEKMVLSASEKGISKLMLIVRIINKGKKEDKELIEKVFMDKINSGNEQCKILWDRIVSITQGGKYKI